MDPRQICKKTRKLRGKLANVCRNETALLKEVAKGVAMGASECGYQFKTRRWNCTTDRKSMRKILLKGKTYLEYLLAKMAKFQTKN